VSIEQKRRANRDVQCLVPLQLSVLQGLDLRTASQTVAGRNLRLHGPLCLERSGEAFGSRSIVYLWYTTVWVKKSPLRGPAIFIFFHKRLRIFNRFFTHLLYVPIYARFRIFIQLSTILTKLCHIKRYYPVHIICLKCLPPAKTHAFKLLRKSLIALSIVVCVNSHSQCGSQWRPVDSSLLAGEEWWFGDS